MNLKTVIHVCSAIFLALGLTGCFTTPKPKILASVADYQQPRKLVVFFDGTANDETSDTNIKRLQSLVTLQGRQDISTFYVEGVGANGKAIGMGTGWGMGYRERLAYQYLAENYRKNDKIYLFGFSRGAYAARILASLLYHAGLPEQPLSAMEENKKSNAHFAKLIYAAFKGDMPSNKRKESINETVNANNLPRLNPVEVTFMGLWETVEALGVPDYEENTGEPNRKYGDQLCNVRRAAHALALDDNRARIFTPILLTREHLVKQCDKDIDGRDWVPTPESIRARLNATVNEVWFTGAHADVGGGYLNSLLSGVSLNWMIGQLQGKENDEGLLPACTKVRSDPDENVNDPEAGLLWGTLYKELWRSFAQYAANSPYNNGRLKIHNTVIKRLQKPERLTSPTPRESQWRLREVFTSCFGCIRNATNGYDYRQNRSDDCLLDIVETASPPSSCCTSPGTACSHYIK
jgi:uncharacterized protein (DUF2235 family)